MSEVEAAWLRLGLRSLGADLARSATDRRPLSRAAPQLRWQTTTQGTPTTCVCSAAPTVRPTAPRARRRRRRHRRALPAGADATAGLSGLVHGTPCPEAEAWAAECVIVPCFPELTAAEVDLVADALANLPGTPVTTSAEPARLDHHRPCPRRAQRDRRLPVLQRRTQTIGGLVDEVHAVLCPWSATVK